MATPPPPLTVNGGGRSNSSSNSSSEWLRRLAEWRPPSPSSSASSSSSDDSDSGGGGLLDLVEVISVGSSDEEDGPVVVPLEVLVKREAPAADDASHEVVVKSELRAVAAHDAGFLVDLCSDDSDSDAVAESNVDNGYQRHSVITSPGTSGFTYELASDSDDDGRGEWRADSGGRSMILRFKRRKMRHDSAGTGESRDASVGLYYGGGADEVAAAAAELSSDSDSEAYASDSYNEDHSIDGDSETGDKDEDDEDDEDEVADGGGYSHLVSTQPSLSSHSLSRAQVDAIILNDVKKLEAQKPWRFVYRCLEVPFQVDRTTDAFDLLFERWDAFWKSFGRAVWERYFWAPLQVGSLEYSRRKHRQWRAARTFRLLAVELYEKLGQGFLRQVSRQAHDGWWYRSPPLMLRELFNLDRRKYGMYMTLYRERFPRGSRFERSLDASWCLDSVLSTENDDCGVDLDLAHKAWQDVARSDDGDVNGEECGANDESE